jgi:hypothetical protein
MMFFYTDLISAFVFFLQIWIKPEHSKLLTPIFRNLKDLWLWHIFPECDLNWTLFILEAAPALQMFIVSLLAHLPVNLLPYMFTFI